MDDKDNMMNLSSQWSSQQKLASGEDQSLHEAQLVTSTPARNMGTFQESNESSNADYTNLRENRSHQVLHNAQSQGPFQDRLDFNESAQQKIDDVGFKNLFDLNHPRGLFHHGQSFIGSQHEDFPRKRIHKEDNSPKSYKPKCEMKERKSITTKTFAKGMMDVSLLTSNATQLRAVLSNKQHEFYSLLLWLITLSITLQILSSVLLLMSDYFKTDVKEKDRQNQRKRKLLNFLSLALVTVVTSLNILISVFSTPTTQVVMQTTKEELYSNIPQFANSTTQGSHSEL